MGNFWGSHTVLVTQSKKYVWAFYFETEVHEIEEMHHMHLFDIIKNYETSFDEIRNYYNEITNDNLNMITALKVSHF